MVQSVLVLVQAFIFSRGQKFCRKTTLMKHMLPFFGTKLIVSKIPGQRWKKCKSPEQGKMQNSILEVEKLFYRKSPRSAAQLMNMIYNFTHI